MEGAAKLLKRNSPYNVMHGCDANYRYAKPPEVSAEEKGNRNKGFGSKK